jgi:transcription initiation factor TFIIIB Brf1 subunit/transcription initiation factor TFIIB
MEDDMGTIELPTTITATAVDWYECQCGNNPASGLGFESVAEDNVVTVLVCLNCGLVMDPSTLDLEAQAVSVIGREQLGECVVCDDRTSSTVIGWDEERGTGPVCGCCQRFYGYVQAE